MAETSRQRASVVIRDLRADDVDAITAIDARHTGEEKRDYWERTVARFLTGEADLERVGLAAEGTGDRAGEVCGYLLGEVRAFEFGSEPCGWIFSCGVLPELARGGVATWLLAEATTRFARAGVRKVRTMVRRKEIPVLRFFRSSGFVGGPFTQLELDLQGD